MSGGTFPNRLTKIDDLTRPDHYYLSAADACYFIGEYTARKGYAFSATNQLILNLKKTMDKRGQPQWRWKGQAIQEAAAAFRAALILERLNSITFVPVPPSKAKDDPLYDDRITQMLQLIRPQPRLDIRELVIQRASTSAVHDSSSRPTPAQLEANYDLDTSLMVPLPQTILIVDDVLTTGAHFCAVRAKLSAAFPTANFVGLFVARRVPDSADFEEFLKEE